MKGISSSRHLSSATILALAGFGLLSIGCRSASAQVRAQDQGPVALPAQNANRVDAPRPTNDSALDLTSFNTSSLGNARVTARILATVNGVAIIDEELREATYHQMILLTQIPEPERSVKRKEILEKELQQLIDREVILQEAMTLLKDRPSVLDKLREAAGKEYEKRMRDVRKRAGTKTDDEFKAFLKSQGISLAGVRRQIERNFMAMEFMKNAIFSKIDRIGRQELREYYEAHPEEFQIPDSVVWLDIFIDAARFPNRDAAQQFAEQLIVKAKAGEDFEQLVKQYDNGDSSYRNGEGFGHRRGEIKPTQAEPIVFQMKDGEIGPLITLNSGFHVIKLVKREYAGMKPFDEKTQATIRGKLQNETWERESKRVVAELKRRATIVVSAKGP